MEKKYWIGRGRASTEMARGAVTSEARLAHYELAGRYSIKAAQCPSAAIPARQGERAMLHLFTSPSLRPERADPRPDPFDPRVEPDPGTGGRR